MGPELQAGNLSYRLLDNKYRIGPRFENGGYGTVYYAQNLNDQRFAIKAIKLQIKNRPGIDVNKMLQNLKKQHQKMFLCSSDYIMKCYEALQDQQNKLRFIVMQLCQFSSLQNLIYLKGHLQQGEAKNILKHSLCGLQQIHQRGLCHRDIKTSNVCFKQNRCILCDFGCSKQFLNKDQVQCWRKSIRKQGTILGTIISKSPEMLQNKQYGLKTDLWAIGILFYECLTGVPPFLFDTGFSDQQACKFIRENIDNIYNPGYIRANLRKNDLQERGNINISQKAKKFLNKLIVYDQNQRYSLAKLEEEQYLFDQQQYQKWQKAKCVIPLKQINWKLHVQSLKKIDKSLNKQQNLNNIKVKKITTKLVKLDQQIRIKLKDTAKKILSQQKQIYNNAKIIHFEIRRLNLLKDFRTYLQQQTTKNEIKIKNVCILISMYGFLKLKQINQKLNKKGLQPIKNNFDIQQLWNVMQGMYNCDQKYIKQRKISWRSLYFNKFKQIFISESFNNLFYEEIKNQSFETVYKFIQKEIQKVYKELKKRQCKGCQIKFIQFLLHSKIILQVNYVPNSAQDLWQNWKNFRQILMYINSKKNYLKN